MQEIHTIPVLVTFIACAGALLLAGYFTLRHQLALATVCMGCFLALFRPSVAFASETCKPHHYPDGDTFYYKRAGEEVRVRVAGFDAPERGQPFSQVAKRRMMEMTSQGANCDCYKQDRHGRSVCTVKTQHGENVATVMLAAGLGCIDERFEKEASPADRWAGREALEQAKQARRGMWSQPNPVCGYDYRRQKAKS